MKFYVIWSASWWAIKFLRLSIFACAGSDYFVFSAIMLHTLCLSVCEQVCVGAWHTLCVCVGFSYQPSCSTHCVCVTIHFLGVRVYCSTTLGLASPRVSLWCACNSLLFPIDFPLLLFYLLSCLLSFFFYYYLIIMFWKVNSLILLAHVQ